MTHICVSKLTFIGSDNGLSPGRRQAIIWTNAWIWLIGPLGTNFNEIFIEIHTFSSKKIYLKMSSGKWRPFCLGLNVLKVHLLQSIKRPTSHDVLSIPVCFHNVTLFRGSHVADNILTKTQHNILNIYLDLTHWGRDKMDATSQTTLSNAFSWMKLLEFWLKIHWSLFLRVQLTILQHCFR